MTDHIDEDLEQYDLCQTVNLTIEIDEPTIVIEESFEQITVSGSLPRVGPSKNLEEALALARIGEDVLVRDLPDDMRKELCTHLNINPFGTSMRNWETVAAKMGASSDEILGLKSSTNPTGELLSQKKSEKVNVLLEAIAKSGRVDTLVSMRKFAMRRIQKQAKVAPIIGNNFSTASTVPCTSKYDDYTTVALLIHYETSKDERKAFKKFKLNFNLQLPPEIFVEDLLEIDASENFYAQLLEAFQKASHVIVCLTHSYCQLISSIDSPKDDSQKAVKNVHNLMDTEFGNNNCKNKRFRPLIMEESISRNLPLGWASSTTLYRWPNDFHKLIDRVKFNPMISQTM
ncbi:unnamed protein product, partial [Mesorhabditis belari]|uniref:Uncharacterized protein n=1 Tax=Mesorhabditis belari TaxID=2138241 RepID=A0AAF3FQ12_9BILA